MATRVEVGWPGTRILEVARERHSCAIAMATHGRSGLARVVLGSVATLTLQQSPAPLLVARPVILHAPRVLGRNSPALDAAASAC